MLIEDYKMKDFLVFINNFFYNLLLEVISHIIFSAIFSGLFFVFHIILGIHWSLDRLLSSQEVFSGWYENMSKGSNGQWKESSALEEIRELG